MSKYLGDFVEDATVRFGFTTNDGSGGRASFSASLEEADIVIFKDGTAMTLEASTITITSEPGSRTGVHLVSIDMSNDTDFTTGSDYIAVLYPSDETIDSQAPAAILAHWSCENRVVTPKDASITNAKLADDAISAAKIAANSITAAKISDDAITEAKMSAIVDLLRIAVAGAAGTVAVTDNGTTLALSFKDTDGTTEVANVTYTKATGARTRNS